MYAPDFQRRNAKIFRKSIRQMTFLVLLHQLTYEAMGILSVVMVSDFRVSLRSLLLSQSCAMTILFDTSATDFFCGTFIRTTIIFR